MRLAALFATLLFAAGCSEQATLRSLTETDLTTINLGPMDFDEYSRVVPPNLGCSFEVGGAILLVASAPDDRAAQAEAVVKIDGELVPMTRSSVGGYRSLLGITNNFQGRGYEVAINHAGGEGRRSGVETTVWPARLTIRNSEGRSQLTGDWNCGA